jgi:glycine/D-amino acid oxidase-like deaminating enzyme
MLPSLLHTLHTALTAPRRRTDVAIVGGGVVGTSLAYHLSRHQSAPTVCLVDRECVGSGATGLSAGTLYTTLAADATPPPTDAEALATALGPATEPDLDARLVARTLATLRALEADGYDCGLVECGGLTLLDAPVSPELRAEYWDLRRRGHRIDLLTPKRTRALEPAVRADADDVWALHTPLSAYVDPSMVAQAFADAAVASGRVDVVEGVGVVGLEKRAQGGALSNATLVLTDGTTHAATTVVLCTGVGGQALLREAWGSDDGRVPDDCVLTPVEGTMWTMRPDAPDAPALSHIVYTTGSSEYWRDHPTTPPRCTHSADGTRLVDHLYGRPLGDGEGGAVFGAGRVPVVGSGTGDADGGEAARERLAADVVRRGADAVERRLRLVAEGRDDDGAPVPGWTGAMPFASSGRPVVREVRPGVWVVNGFGPKGVMLGPGVTAWVAEAVVGCRE